MKYPILFSSILHIVVIILFMILSSFRFFRPQPQVIYPVELITLPKIEKTSVPKSSEKPEIKKPEPKVVETPVATPKKTIPQPVKTEKKEEPKEKPAPPAETAPNQVKIDTKDFPFAYYLNLLRYKVQENWHPPFQNAAKNEKISTMVKFKILRNGQITEIKLENKSGRYLYDQAAQRAVISVRQLPPLPAEFSGEYLIVHIEFEGAW